MKKMRMGGTHELDDLHHRGENHKSILMCGYSFTITKEFVS
jgi:hypothetical protein